MREKVSEMLKVAVLSAAASAGVPPEDLMLPDASGEPRVRGILRGVVEQIKTAADDGGTVAGDTAKTIMFRLLPLLAVGIPAMGAYNLQRLRQTANADMRAALDVETISALDRAAADAERTTANLVASRPPPSASRRRRPAAAFPALAKPAPSPAEQVGGFPW